METITADWLCSPAIAALRSVFGEGSGWFVGGCVRDAVLGRTGGDIDLATSLTPNDVTKRAQALGLRVVPTGIDHGTVTILADDKSFEVTTFRQDIETDGRHAVVTFGADMQTDANRRDFTMNALYCDFEGQVFDPTGQGLTDLHAGHVRFIGDARQRVAEDYLRILRFFRFTAWFGSSDLGVDAEGLAAAAAEADGLERVAKERITHEILRLLQAPDPLPALAAMSQSGILTRILPGAAILPMQIVLHCFPDAPVTLRLAALCAHAGSHLRLTKAMMRQIETLTQASASPTSPLELGYRLGDQGALAVHLRAAIMGAETNEEDLAHVMRGMTAKCPVSAKDLLHLYEGPALGSKLKELEATWLGSNLALTRQDLLARL